MKALLAWPVMAVVLIIAGPVALATPVLAQETSSPAYHIGDMLKISFFEQLDPDAAPGSGGQSAAYYQRLDLTGEYRVESDGTVDLPRLGRIAFAGRDRDAVRGDVLSAYEEEIGTSGDVHVAVVSSQPVYVLGPVDKPGQYKYSPGLMVIQAVALAGGVGDRDKQGSTALDKGREAERGADTRERLAVFLAKRERLSAESAGREIEVPADLISLVGSADAKRLIGLERVARESERDERRQTVRSYQDIGLGLERELREVRRSLESARRGSEASRASLASITEPDPRLTDQQLAGEYRGEIAAFNRRSEDLEREAQTLSRSIESYRNAIERMDAQYRADLGRDMLSVNEEVARLRTAMEGANRLAAMPDPVSAPSELSDYALKIVRLGKEGSTSFNAEPTTPLAPGDVVTIEARPERAQAGG
ncbi:MAG: polysaccharide biosynthesis/export family protein [Pseudomonadota bacterium]|nr:polysaccharide biosynthesis/export family protein [Pseudomonadota bacterium]